MEHCLSEGAVMIAFALHVFDRGATAVSLHPDGEHGKRYDLKACLAHHGFRHTRSQGSTSYGGEYTREHQLLTILPKPGLGDVIAQLDGRKLVAECKGGVINSKHAGQLSRLRSGLCEAVGLLLARPHDEQHIAVVPYTPATLALARRMIVRTLAAGIRIALVDADGRITFVEEQS